MPAKLRSVSYVMPVLNEEKHLAHAVESIFSQEFDGPTEVILALGPSKDGTNSVAADLAKRFKVVLVENPTGKTPAGLNHAIRAASHDVVVRVDAHSVLSPGYTQSAVDILNETGADNVGGLMRSVGETPFQRAVAFAYQHRIGLGGGAFHVGGEAGPSDTVYLGVFRREKLLAVGLFDEELVRGQDWELNMRIRTSGGTVWFDPRLEVEYYPRSTLRALSKQFFDTGFWRARITKLSPGQASLRYFVPPALVVASVLIAPAVLYFAVVLLVSLTAGSLAFSTRLRLIYVLPVMHYCWGAGFIRGLFARHLH